MNIHAIRESNDEQAAFGPRKRQDSARDRNGHAKKPMQPVPAVNFHLLLACNMACSHCFASNIAPKCMPVEDAVRMIGMISHAGFVKINFAGGEPMLHPGLDQMILAARQAGMVTSMVTNGTRVTDRWLDGMSGYLNWIALSVDSANPKTHELSGRATPSGPMSTERYLTLCKSIRRHGIRLKINTVVTKYNHHEDMKDFIRGAKPERWKIMRALPVLGQNDDAKPFKVTRTQFDAYVERNRHVYGTVVVPEDNNMMTGSYVMIDPLGHFYDNVNGTYRYSRRPILQAGVEEALQDVRTDLEKFAKRGGRYDW